MKGQWFIISAVIASSVFLTLSLFLKDYFVTDTSSQAGISNDFYLHNIQEQLDRLVATAITDDPPTCINLTTNLNEFRAVAERVLAARGLFLNLNYTIADCSAANDVKFNIIIASQEAVVYNFTTHKVSDIIG